MEPKKNFPGKAIVNVLLLIGIPILLFLTFNSVIGSRNTDKKEEQVYSDYIQYFIDNKVEEFHLNLGTGKMAITLRPDYRTDVNKDGKVTEKDYVIVYTVPNVSHFVSLIDPILEEVNQDDRTDNDVKYDFERISDMSWLFNWLPIVLLIVLMLIMFFSMRRSLGSMDGGPGKIMGFGKAKIKQASDDKRGTTFDDVAGADEEKEELREVVEFLKDPRRFTELGARVPKGVLLVGPPGTGKTLLARAVAGEAGVPFFSMSGSDFVEMYVGVGASRVRDLFEQAKKSAPCIIFIDEIDAVGRQRGAGLGGGHDEREQTLNQLLVEMDGFSGNEGIIMIAATNRPDVLDHALMRPGRFDRQVVVNTPDLKGREEILKVHAKGKPLAPDVDLSVVAKSTAGFTGADLENLLNEAALLAARRNLHAITMSEIDEATVKVVVGTEKRSHVMTEKEKKLTAYHEAGHAVVTYFCDTQDPVHQISVIPRGMAGGYTMSLPQQDRSYKCRNEMLEDIQVLLGGRVAEALTLEDISTGASNDIERATEIARKMITKFGMSDKLGPICYAGSDSDEVFLGRDFGHARNHSEEIAAQIDAEVHRMLSEGYAETERKLKEHMDMLVAVAERLIVTEKMDGEEFRRIMEENPQPEQE
ncbi:MAG: ATP-dependent zinc metalloprotease FtsH [Clostridia bacterium]|nr:ATP-dependent zinc metalloprotease FtsH [Clostridia bacterium]